MKFGKTSAIAIKLHLQNDTYCKFLNIQGLLLIITFMVAIFSFNTNERFRKEAGSPFRDFYRDSLQP